MTELMEFVTETREIEEPRSGRERRTRSTSGQSSVSGAEPAVKGFDYSQISPDVAKMAKEAVSAFYKTSRMAFAEILKVGKQLLLVKHELGHGRWMAYVKTEFPHSHRTVTTWMCLADTYDSAEEMEAADLPLSGLGLLASCKDSVRRQQVMDGLQSGRIKKTATAVRKAIAGKHSIDSGPCALAQEAAGIHRKHCDKEMDLLTSCVRSLAQRGAKNASNAASVRESQLPDSWIETTVRSAMRALCRVTGTDAEIESGEAPRLEGRCKELWHLLQQLLEAGAAPSTNSASPILDRLRECAPALKNLIA